MSLFRRGNTEFYGGLLMILIGLGTVFGSFRYHIGTLSDMGSGFFPAAVGACLAFVGFAITLTAKLSPKSPESGVAPDWRGIWAIVAGTLSFVVVGVYGGLIPATFAIVFISALGDRSNSLREAFWLAAGVVLFCVIVFSLALQVQLPLFGWGLR